MRNFFKDFFKYLIVILVCIGCVFAYESLLSPSIVSIYKSETNGLYDTYVFEYSNGKKDLITIKNGEDGKDSSIEDLYQAAKILNGYGDDYTILDFIKEYASFSIEQQDEAKAYLGALSSVEVYSAFPTGVSSNSGTYYGMGMGSGVIFQTEGDTENYYIITNYHVVYNTASISSNKLAEKFTCFLYGSKVEITSKNVGYGYQFTYGSDAIDCEYVGGSMQYDIAVLKVKDSTLIKKSNAKPVTVCKNDPVMGQTIVAIGNAQGLGVSATKGIVSVDSEYQEMTACDGNTTIVYRAIRIDASVNAGNSGGGVFNTNGELVGIVNSKLSDEEIEGMAFALPAELSVRIANNIIANATENNHSAYKPTLGLTLKINSSKAEYNAESNGVKIIETVSIEKIEDNSVCRDLLKVGDIVNSVVVGGKEYTIDRMYKLVDLTWLMKKDEPVVFKVTRLGNSEDITIVVSRLVFGAVQ